MPSRARDRHLAKNAERRRLEKERSRRNRQAALGVGIGVLVILLVLLAIGLITRRQSEEAAASATPSTSASATTSKKPVQTGTVSATTTPSGPVACGSDRPPTADQPKPQFDRAPTPKEELDPNTTYTAVIETSCGTIKVALDSQAAPQTVASFVFLAEQHYFDGTFFHRVVDSIDVIQGGDPEGSGAGGPGYSIPDELSGKEHYAPGTIAMANAGPGTGGSQFFIITGPEGKNLDNNPNYTIFGHVTEGLDVAQQINSFMKTKDGTYDGPPTKAVYVDKVTIETAKSPASPSASPSA
jgi:cyclophilin family peptidyl-prolyl cis-trans isomerase